MGSEAGVVMSRDLDAAVSGPLGFYASAVILDAHSFETYAT